MQWVVDTTGRFRWRPWYRTEEIDALCEERVRRFLRARYGAVAYPLTTNDLVRLIEQDVGDLDLFADLACLSNSNGIVEGVTTFVPGRRPWVRIARELSDDPRREGRLRTTLAHELGHVLLHNVTQDHPAPCQPETVIRLAGPDWMEWQAAYASGALLMPRTVVRETVRPLLVTLNASVPIRGQAMGRVIDVIQAQFLVSESAAFVRLHQLGYLRRGTGCVTQTSRDETHRRQHH